MQTTANNRRDSLLELFDPLAGPHTPPRSTGSASPDSSLGSSSDKENDSPVHMPACGPVTEFFMRVYKDPKHAPPLPQTPIGRLVDLSMSVDGEEEEEDLENRGDKENGEQMEVLEECVRADDSTAEYLEEMRMPLAELQLEKLSPPSSEAQASMDVDPPASDSNSLSPPSTQPPSPPAVTAAPFGTPFADVINSINHRDSPSISINICAPDEDPDDMVFEPEYVSPFAPRNAPQDSHLSPDVSLTFSPDVSTSTLRRGVTTGSEDPRRISCDLQTSFSLVMQSTEMSFDLLNDKVSFFGQGQQAEHEHDQSWPGEHADDTTDFTSKNTKESAGVEMMQAGDTSMEDDTFDFTKEKSKMDALDEKYGSIHQEQLRAVEKAAEAAVANSPRQRSTNVFPMPRFSLSPRPSPLREELLSAKEEAVLEESVQVVVPNIFSQYPKDLNPEAAQESKAPPPPTTQPRRSSTAAPTPLSLSRRKSIPALLFNTTKSPTKSEHVRAASSSSTSTTSSADTARASLSRRGSVSSSKANDTQRSIPASASKSFASTAASIGRRGSMSAMKVASLGRSTTTKMLAKPDLEGTSPDSNTSLNLNLNISRRGSISGLKLQPTTLQDNTRSTPSTSLVRRGSVAGLKGLPAGAGRPSTSAIANAPVKVGQSVKGVQRPGVSVKAGVPTTTATKVAPSRLLSASQRTAPSTTTTRPSTASTATSARPSTSMTGRVAVMGRSISSGLQRSTTTASTSSSASGSKAGALRAPHTARPSTSQAVRPSTSQAARSSTSNSNSTSTGSAAPAPVRRIPSKLPGFTRAGSTSIGGAKAAASTRKV